MVTRAGGPVTWNDVKLTVTAGMRVEPITEGSYHPLQHVYSVREVGAMSTQVETLEFQAEARQLLHLVIHSIYSNKDIFLRELISNASDALDKLRLASFADKELQVDISDPSIEISVDQDERTLTVTDNGIGMSRAEVVDLIGTIARSGTAELLQRLKGTKETNGVATTVDLIGQFGVGFYSCFMVADRVSLVTRRAGETEATRW